MTGASKARVAVVGSTGYAGAELVRLLSAHPGVQTTVVTSEREAGRPLGQVHRSLGFLGLDLSAVDVDGIAGRADLAFVALPHGRSTAVVAGLLERGLRVVDLGADFRFAERDIYERWYGEHEAPGLLKEAVYGLTEHARDEVAKAELVANPGCYPTGMLLGVLPLVARVRGTLIIDSKSGTSGAGRTAKAQLLFGEVTENVRPYSVGAHRHQPEMQSQLAAVGCEYPVVFSPHLLPMARGLLSTCYLDVEGSTDSFASLFADAYEAEPFIDLLGEGVLPETRNVRGTNRVEIGWVREAGSGKLIVLTAIDNLGKGAAGQAIQNMNLMLGLPETTGLELTPALP